MPEFGLRSLSLGARAGLTCLCVVMCGGLAASVGHLYMHDNKRDERPGLTVDDVKGVYHGIRSKAPLLVALERGHPETLKADDRQRLTAWLTGKDVSRVYDDLDLGDKAPEAIIAASCRSCHSRDSKDAVAKELPLERADDVLKNAASRDINPNSVQIVAASTHTHALSLGMLGMMVVAMASATRWARGLVGLLGALCGLGLLTDISGWWLTRHYEECAYMVMAGGGTFIATTVLLLLMIVLDLWWPKRGG